MPRQSYATGATATGISNARALGIAAVLCAIALGAQWLLWLDRETDAADSFSGPPRSDYVARDYSLTARDDAGAFTFRVTGPRAVRHPFLGTFDLDQPRLRFRDDQGNEWHARANAGWVSKDGGEVRLSGAVQVQRQPKPGVDPIQIESERLIARPKIDELESPDAVTITEPGSILRGVGMHAKLKEHHLELDSQVRAHFDPQVRAKK